MRSFLFFLLTAFLFQFSFSGGGPDTYGYYWLDSNDPNGPAYSWVDITNSGTMVTGLADDNAVGGSPSGFPIGFDFHYYWGDVGSVEVGSNGWIGFETNNANIAHCFPPMPTPGSGDMFIAPFMTDLIFNAAGTSPECYYWSNNVDSFVVSYINVPWWAAGAQGYAGSNTFQVVLSGQDSSITFNYMTMDGANFNDNAGCLTDLSIGIENQTGGIGLQVATDTLPPSMHSVKFYYPDVVSLQIPDLTPDWSMNAQNGGVFYLLGGVPVNAMISNVGNTDILTSSTITAEIFDPVNLVYSQQLSIPFLAAGGGSPVSFSPMANLNTAGSYLLSVSSNNNADLNAGNNGNLSEVNIVDLSSGSTYLTYSQALFPTTQVVWGGGGNEGAGIYIEPPVYPIEITDLEPYITQPFAGGMSGYSVVILDDDGPNGGPGTTLRTVVVPSSSAIPNQFNLSAVTPPLQVDSGGVYVGFLQNGDSVGIGSEQELPISRRTYEIIGGDWAPYRSNEANDLLYRVHISTISCAPISSFNFLVNNFDIDLTENGVGGTSWMWDFGDGQSGVGSSISHNYLNAGFYDVCLITTNTCGSDTTCQNVEVGCSPPAADFSVANNQLTSSFTNLASGNPDFYFWDFGDGNSSNDPFPTHQYSNSGTYTVCQVVSSLGCGMDTLCQNVSLCGDIMADFEFSATDLSVQFTDASLYGNDVFWDFGDGNISTQANPMHSYASSGSYTVCVTSSSICDVDSLCNVVEVCISPQADWGYTLNGLSLDLNSLSSADNDHSWNFGDGNTSTVQSPSHVYSTYGIYNVCQIVQNACGADTFCVEIVTCEEVMDTTYDFTSEGLSFTFQNNVTGANAYSWNFGDGNASSDENPMYDYSAPGTYEVCLLAWNECFETEYCQMITVCEEALSNFGWELNGVGGVMFSDSSSGGDGLLWTFGDGSQSSQDNPNYIYAVDGQYEVCLVVTNDCESDTSCQTVIPNFVSVMSDLELSGIQIFPNPTNSDLTISLDSRNDFLLSSSVFDLTGKKLLSLDTEKENTLVHKYDLGMLPSGIYILKLRTNTGLFTQKIIKN